jgi:hypothetical protein
MNWGHCAVLATNRYSLIDSVSLCSKQGRLADIHNFLGNFFRYWFINFALHKKRSSFNCSSQKEWLSNPFTGRVCAAHATRGLNLFDPPNERLFRLQNVIFLGYACRRERKTAM